jgi:hypothetical protein
MLAVQMVATHLAATSALRRLNSSETVSVQDSNGNLAVKAAADFHDAGRGSPAVPREGAAKSHGRACPRPFWCAGDRRSLAVNKSGKIGGLSLIRPEQVSIGQMLRCGARTRSGRPCRSPAVRGKRRCRMHGGAAGSGAPVGNKNAFRHGYYTAEAIAQRRGFSHLIRVSRTTVAKLSKRD